MSKVANGQTIIQAFESWSPKSYAMDGDKIGLMVGTLNKPVHKMMITLDVLEEVIDEAIEKNIDFILAHHPLIYRPLKNIATDTSYGRIIEKAIKHEITIYAAHTNLDIAPGGVNDMLAEALQLTDTKVLVPTKTVKYKKLVVFVPKSHAESVRQALGDVGCGHIGDYSHCTFNSEGIGTFLPLEGTNPYIGHTGKKEEVEEIKIETILPETLQKKAITAMMKAHPYEEVAFDIYPLDNDGEVLGLGKIGYLKNEMTLQQFANFVKEAFDVKGVRVVGNLNNKVKKVAVVGGDGNKFVKDAIFQGADVYVTGDVYYHVAHDAMMEGLNIVDPGHNVEKIMKHGVKKKLEQFLQRENYETEIIVSNINTDPFTFL